MRAELLPVTRWVLRDQRRGLLLWAIALVAVSAMYTAFYPSMANQNMEQLMEGLPEGLRASMGWDAIATGAGYLHSTVYGLLAPILLLVFGISHGARLIAGEEEAGTLELEHAAPVTRTSVVLQRWFALAIGMTSLVAALGATTLVLAPALDMGIAAGNIIAATAGLWLFVLAMASVAFAVGAATGVRAIAQATGATLAFGAYITNALAPAVDGAAWLADVSPFGWYAAAEPLTNGADLPRFAGLATITVVALAVGVWRHNARDISG